MKKVELKIDLKIQGLGIIPQGTKFEVEKFNSRFIYVKVNDCILRLTKSDVNILR